MKEKVKKIFRSNYKVLIGIIIGVLIAGTGVYAAVTIAASAVTYSNTNSGITSTNLQGAIDELYEKAKSTEFKVGDYVQMRPTKTSFTIPLTLSGYTSDRTINPSELYLWRVIRINADGTIDMVSVKVSSVDIYIKGKTGYQNYVATLNYIARQYENSKYTSGSRAMGYNGQTEYITNTKFLTTTTAPQTSSTSSSNVTSTTEAQGLGDVGYETDINLVNTACGTLSANDSYWIASRYYTYRGSGSTPWEFSIRRIISSGTLSGTYVLRYTDGSFDELLQGTPIRPIVVLKSGVKASSGSGTKSEPYLLN